MATLPGLDKTVTKDPTPPATDTVVSPITIPNGTILVTTKTTNETIDNVNQIIDYISGDAGPNFIPQSAINNLVSDLAAKEILLNKVVTVGTPGNDTNYPTEKAVRDALDLKEDSLGFTPEDSANKGAVSGYAALDSSQLLLLANFPTGTALQVLRRNAANTALEFAVAGSEVFTWTADHSADNNNLTNLGELQFDANTTILRAGSNLDFNVATSSSFKFTIDPDVKLTITDTNTRLHGNNLQIEGGNISFDTANNFIDQVGNNLQFSLNENNALYEFLIGSNQTLSISALTTNNHNRRIINVSDPTNAQDVVTKAFGDANYLNANSLNGLSDVTITAPADNDLLEFDTTGNLWKNRQGVFTGITGLGVQTQDLVIGTANEIIMSNSTEIRWVNGNRRIFNDTSGFIFEVQVNDVFKFRINTSDSLSIDGSSLTLLDGQSIDGAGLINFAESSGSFISGIATALGIKVDLQANDIFRIDVAGSPEYTFNDSQADFAGNSLKNIPQILDVNGNEMLTFVTIASAVNFAQFTNSATLNPLLLSAMGDDANIDYRFIPKGTGTFYGNRETWAWPLTDETTAPTTGVKFVTEPSPYDMLIEDVIAGLTTAGTGGALFTIDVLKETGVNTDVFVSIFTTNLTTIDASEFTSTTATTQPNITTTTWEKGRRLQLSISVLDTNGLARGAKIELLTHATAK